MPSNLMQFAEFAAEILDEEPLVYPAVMKEIIHIESLRALSDVGLFRKMVFQGEPSIRLCYGGLRYSEDLDFSAIGEISNEDMDVFFECLCENALRLGLEVDEPLEVSHKDFRDRGGARKWQSRIVFQPPLANRPDLRSSHFVKIELDDHKVFEQVIRPVEIRHANLGQQGALVSTKSANELMVDKAIAFVDRTSMKWRDVFDIHQLSRRGTNLDIDMLKSKLSTRYERRNDVEELIGTRRKELKSSTKRQGFAREMRGLLPSRERDVWFSEGVVNGISEDAELILNQLSKCIRDMSFAGRGSR